MRAGQRGGIARSETFGGFLGKSESVWFDLKDFGEGAIEVKKRQKNGRCD